MYQSIKPRHTVKQKLGEPGDFEYSRSGNPTRLALEGTDCRT